MVFFGGSIIVVHGTYIREGTIRTRAIGQSYMISLVIRVSNFCFFFDFLYRYGSVRIDLHVLVTVSTECRIEHTFHIVFVQSNQKHDDRSETHSQNLKKRIALCTTYVVFSVA